MSMYNYPNWHEIKDLTGIYNEDEWDDAEILVWDPEQQKHCRLVFCGSTRPLDGHKPNIEGTGRGFINFVIYHDNSNNGEPLDR